MLRANTEVKNKMIAGNCLSEVIALAPVRSSTTMNFDDVLAEEYFGSAVSFARASYQQPAIIVQFAGFTDVITPQQCGGRRSFRHTENHSAVLPCEFEHGGQLYERSHFVAIYPSQSLLRRMRNDLDGQANIDLKPQFAARDPHLHALALAFRAELEAGCASSKIFLESLANALAAHLLNAYAVAAAPALREYKGGISGRKLRDVIDYITENLAASLSLAELAAIGGANQFHFARQFKRMTGETPHFFVMRQRVERAAQLLIKTDEPIAQIALATGFPDQSHLTRWFKRLTTRTPAVYRRSGQK